MADENALISRVVEKLESDLNELDNGHRCVVGATKDGHPIEEDPIYTRLAIGTFLVRVAVARTNAAQGWMKLAKELGREQMLELLDRIAGRAPALPPSEGADQ